MAWPSLDGIIRCGERLRAWAFDARSGTFVGTRLSHTEKTREIADGSVMLAGTRQLSGPEPLWGASLRGRDTRSRAVSCFSYAHDQMKQMEAHIARMTDVGT